MLSFLKGTGAIIGTIGVGLTINYHLSSPLFDVEQYQQQKWGKKVLPLPFPDDMETRWPVRLINSVGDTYLRVTGSFFFLFFFLSFSLFLSLSLSFFYIFFRY